MSGGDRSHRARGVDMSKQATRYSDLDSLRVAQAYRRGDINAENPVHIVATAAYAVIVLSLFFMFV